MLCCIEAVSRYCFTGTSFIYVCFLMLAVVVDNRVVSYILCNRFHNFQDK